MKKTSLHDWLEDAVNEFYKELGAQVGPKCKIVDNVKAYNISCELPGVNKSDLDVRIDEQTGVLSFSGEVVHASDDDSEVSERSKFAKRFTLPYDADYKKVEATLKHGMLRFKVPKRDDGDLATSRKIEIKE